MMRHVLKWELRKYAIRVGVCAIPLAAAWLILLLLPVGGEGTPVWLSAVLWALLIMASVLAAGVALYMVLVHPFAIVLCAFLKSSVMEHQTGCTYKYKLSIHMVLNILTYLLGMGVLRITMGLLRRFEYWVDANWFSNMLDDSSLYLMSLLPMMAVGVPLVLVFSFKLMAVYSAHNKNITFRSTLGNYAALLLTLLSTYAERLIAWQAFMLPIIIATSAVLMVAAVWSVSHFVDHIAEVTA